MIPEKLRTSSGLRIRTLTRVNRGQCAKQRLRYDFVSLCANTKGQLISKGPLGVIVSTKKDNEIFLRISALASKKSSNKKTLLYNYVK
jgi:hypothetical protein